MCMSMCCTGLERTMHIWQRKSGMSKHLTQTVRYHPSWRLHEADRAPLCSSRGSCQRAATVNDQKGSQHWTGAAVEHAEGAWRTQRAVHTHLCTVAVPEEGDMPNLLALRACKRCNAVLHQVLATADISSRQLVGLTAPCTDAEGQQQHDPDGMDSSWQRWPTDRFTHLVRVIFGGGTR